MFSVTSFYYKWPAKALQELFTDCKVIPDPEFKSFNLTSLSTTDSDRAQSEPNSMVDPDGKRGRSVRE
jgi:hypothetical protein